MKKRISTVLLFCLLFIFNPLIAIAEEDGWRYLKWGMSFEEVKKAIIANEGKQCDVEIYQSTIDVQWFEYARDKNIHFDVYSNKFPARFATFFKYNEKCPGGYIFDGKLFGIRVKLPDESLIKEIFGKLKEKYPKGKIVTEKQTVNFEYDSDKIKIFSTDYRSYYSYTLYFYEPKVLKEAVNYLDKEIKALEEEKKKKKTKGLF